MLERTVSTDPSAMGRAVGAVESRRPLGRQRKWRWGSWSAAAHGGPELAEVVHHELGGQEDEDECTRRCKELAPLFHSIWLDSIVSPRTPTPVTMEGDPMVLVTLVFDVHDEERVTSALNAEPTLTREPDGWLWVSGDSVLGRIKLAGSQLTFETQIQTEGRTGTPVARGNVRRDRISQLHASRSERGGEEGSAERESTGGIADAEDEIPPEIQDQLFQEYMARHSQNWLDDHIPALDHQTPGLPLGPLS